MKYLVTIKRKQTTNEAQNARKKRVEVTAESVNDAKLIALLQNHNGRYFDIDSVRRA